MDIIKDYLPFFIPYILITVIIAAFTIVHIIKHPNYRFGNKIMWILIAALLQIIGPIIYFAFGREEE